MIKFVPGKGYVMEGVNRGGMLVDVPLESPEEKARQQAYFDREEAFRKTIGDYGQYSDSTVQDLAQLVSGDQWWRNRLNQMAGEVGQGDTGWFLREFSGRENRGEAAEAVNRFLALQQQGLTDEDIMRGIYGENWGRLNPNWMDTTTVDQAPSFDDRYGPAPASSASVDGTKDPRPSDWKPTDQQGDMGNQQENKLDAFMRALADYFDKQEQQQQPQSQRPVTRGLFGKYINKGQEQ